MNELTPQEKLQILSLKGKMSGRKIADVVGRHHSTVNRYIASLEDSEALSEQGAKVLVYDIETAPSKGYFWRRWKENIGEPQVIQNSYVLTWSAKWLGDDRVFGDSVHLHHKKDKLGQPFDKEVVESLHKVLDEADIIVHHNGDNFDLPTMNSRFVYWGFQPPHPPKTVDTLKIARKRFRFPSNALDSLGRYLEIPMNKIKTDFSLWRRCMEGDVSAYEEMMEYNMRDVELLEAVYMKLRAFDTRHPNVALYTPVGGLACACCGSSNLEPTHRYAYTNVSKFPTYRCLDCGKVNRDRRSTFTKEQREDILANIV